LEIDASRMLRARAYIPILDEEFSEIIRFHQDSPELEALRKEVAAEKRRLAKLARKTESLEDELAQKLLRRSTDERIDQDLDAALDAADNDPDAADKCQQRLLDLKSACDEVEFALEWPALVMQTQNELAEMRSLVAEQGLSKDKQRAQLLERE